MSELIEVDSIERLVVHPGETLVVRLPASVDSQEAYNIGDVVKSALPEGVMVLVLHGSTELSVIANGSDDGSDDEDA